MKHSIPKKFCMLATFLVVGTLAMPCHAVDAVWQGGTGSWESGRSWDIGEVPDNGLSTHYSVYIDGNDKRTDSLVTLGTDTSIDLLSVDFRDMLTVDGASLSVEIESTNSGALSAINSGMIIMNGSLRGGTLSTDTTSSFLARDSVSGLTNTGILNISTGTFQDSSNSGHLAMSASTFDGLVENSGTITLGTDNTFCNATIRSSGGAIEIANFGAQQLSGIGPDSTLAFEGLNVIRGVQWDGRWLQFTNGSFSNSGELRAENFMFVNFMGDLSGGILSTDQYSTFEFYDSNLTGVENRGELNVLRGTLLDVNNSGALALSSSNLEGLIQNSGTITLGMNNTFGNATIRGDGGGVEIVNWETEQLTGTGPGSTLAFEGSNVIRGVYIEGRGLQFTGGSFSNTGELRAENYAYVDFVGDLTGGVLTTDETSDFTVFDGIVTGVENRGELNVMRGTLQDVTNSGSLAMSSTVVQGTTHNAGTIQAFMGDYHQRDGAVTVLEHGSLVSDIIGLETGGTLAGRGSVTGDILVGAGGIVAPGDSVDQTGFLDVTGNISLAEGSFFDISVGGTGGGIEYDFIHVIGTAVLGGTLNLSLWGDYQPMLGDSFNILLAGSISGEFDYLSLGFLGNGLEWDVSYVLSDVVPDHIRLDVIAASEVPEPASMLLIGSGLVGLTGLRRRRG